MRIRKVWNDTKSHCHDLSVPPWLQILQHSTPIMISRINSSICSNQDAVTEEGSSTEGKSTSVHGDKCSGSINTKTTASSVSSSLSCNGRWCEEEKVFPLKKRRLSLKRFITQEFENENNNNNNRTSSKNVLKRFKHEIKEKECDEVDQIKKKKMGLRCARRNGLGRRCINQKAKGSTWCHNHHIKPNDDLNHGGNGKKKTRRRRISSILNRTMPCDEQYKYS